jgi:hypothetical protein
MKKLLGIVIISFLCSNISFAHNFITFKKCYSRDDGQKSIEDDARFEEHTYDINKKEKTIVRTFVWTDQMLEKYKDNNIRKIEQSEYKIKAIGENYISTHFPDEILSMEFVFDLKKYTIQTSVRAQHGIARYTLFCE